MSFSTYPQQQMAFGTGVPFLSQLPTPIALPVISPTYWTQQSYWNQPVHPALVVSELQRLAIHQIALQQLAIQLQQQIQQQQFGYGLQQFGGLGNLGGAWPNQVFAAPQSIGQPQFAGVA